MKSKLVTCLLLAVFLMSDVVVFATATSVGAIAPADGISSVAQRRRTRRSQRRRKRRVARRTETLKGLPESGTMQKGAEPTGSGSPMSEAVPNIAPAPAPPVRARPGAPNESGPKIKPPTVQINPPTE